MTSERSVRLIRGQKVPQNINAEKEQENAV